jgi:hypothetical protein
MDHAARQAQSTTIGAGRERDSMMSGVLRYVAVASSIIGLVSGLCLGVALSSAHAQTTASVLKTPAEVKFDPAPKVLTGTLFNTIEQRQRLDRARRRGGVPEDEVVALDAAEPERPVINGFVKRSDGRNTVWVDDVMKRDPRSEVMEQVEPNVVGGSRGAIRLSPIRAESNHIKINKTGSKRLHKSSKKRLRSAFRAPMSTNLK